MTSSRCRAQDKTTCRIHARTVFVTGFDANAGTFINPVPSLVEHNQKSDFFKLLITQEEQEAIKGYLDHDYMHLTPHLYKNADVFIPETADSQVQGIDSALAKYEAAQSEPKVVYRATNIPDPDGSLNTVEDVKAAIDRKYVVGQTITIDGYMSTTDNPHALFDFMPSGFHDMPDSQKNSLYGVKTVQGYVDMASNQFLRNIVYEISTPSGAPVSTFGQTHADKEQEYLLGRGKQFTVIEVIPYTKVVNPVESYRHNQVHATIVRLVEKT